MKFEIDDIVYNPRDNTIMVITAKVKTDRKSFYAEDMYIVDDNKTHPIGYSAKSVDAHWFKIGTTRS